MSQSSNHLRLVSWTFTLLKWPPQSQDLNPIEYLWDVVEREICSLQISSNCVMLSCQYGPKSLRNVSNILLNLCHEELKQFWRQKGVQPGTSNVPNKVASECVYLYFIYIYIYTEQNYKCNTFDWHPCSQHANCTLHLNLRYLWHCAVW